MTKDQTKFSLEEAFSKLDSIVEQLESDETSLEASFSTYKTGMGLLKECNEYIDTVEKKVLMLDDFGEMKEFQ